MEVSKYTREEVSKQYGPSTEKLEPLALNCCHNDIFDVCVHRTEDNFDNVMLWNWNNVNECPSGGGIFEVKDINKMVGLAECSLDVHSAKVF